MKKTVVLVLVCVLLGSGCAAERRRSELTANFVPASPTADELETAKSENAANMARVSSATEPSKAAEAAKGAGKGALAGAKECSAPLALGFVLSPLVVPLIIGAVATVVCLPFGVTIGAVAGAANALTIEEKR